MTLHQQAIDAIGGIPEDRLPALIQFALFLKSGVPFPLKDDGNDVSVREKRKKNFGILKGHVIMAPDFNDTPDCFKEYM